MHVVACRIELRFPSSQSLKERRALLRPVVEGIRHRFSVSVAEVDHGDTWQRAALGVAVVSGSVSQARSLLDDIERFVWSFPDLEVLETERTWLERP